jgi:hypothetical protein
MADSVRANRRPASADNPYVRAERHASERIEQSLDAYREARDRMYEWMFKVIYESPWLAMMVGLSNVNIRRRGPAAPTWEHEELKRMKRLVAESHIEQGTALDAWVRILLYAAGDDKVVDERPFNLVRRMCEALRPEVRPSLDDMKAAVKRQAFALALDEARAIAVLPKLLPKIAQRRNAVQTARRVAATRGALTPQQEQRYRRLEQVLGLDAT